MLFRQHSLHAIQTEFFCIRLSQVFPAIDDGAHDQVVHHFPTWPDTILFHGFEHPA